MADATEPSWSARDASALEAALVRADTAAVAASTPRLCRAIGDGVVDARQLLQLVRLLQRHRQPDAVSAVVEAGLAVGHVSPAVVHKYVLALLDLGRPSAADALLAQLPEEVRSADPEIRAAFARVQKERFLASNGHPAAAVALDRSVQSYLDVYREDTKAYTYQGINVVALLARAARDGVRVAVSDDPARLSREIAEDILGVIDALEDPEAWDLATAAEAALALDDYGRAAKLLDSYLTLNNDAFAIHSTLRQLERVWSLNALEPPGKGLVSLLRASLLGAEGTALVVPLTDLTDQALRNMDSAEGRFVEQGIFADAEARPLSWLVQALEAARTVVRLESARGPIGTGFIVSGDLVPHLNPTRHVIITAWHVVRDLIRWPDQVLARLWQADGESTPVAGLTCLWAGYADDADACVLSLPDDSSEGTTAAQIRTELGHLDTSHRGYVIGHPQGRGAHVSLHGSKLAEVLPQRLSYRSATEEGSSGSPVFDESWKVIGIHRGYSADDGVNWGLRIDHILDLIRSERVTGTEAVRMDQATARSLAAEGERYRPTGTVRARRLTEKLAWTSGGGSDLAGGPGDWELSDGSDSWTITDEAFTATYLQRPDGRWSKKGHVRAVPLDRATDVETPEGVARGEPGDWLATSPDAGAWPIAVDTFARRYALADAQD